MKLANLSEVFTSIQGEGVFAGRVQLFIRFTGCNLDCYYCDTLENREDKGFALFEKKPLTGKFQSINNPIEEDFLLSYVRDILKNNLIHSISITGGEPLLYSDFLKSFLPKMFKQKPVHLETNGTLPEKLKKVIDYIDFVSMDFKTDYFNKEGFLEQQEEFLWCASKKKCQAKIVITKKIKEEPFKHAISIIEKVDRKIPLILQPNFGEIKQLKSKLIKFYKIASQRLENILIIPQIHKFMDLK
jgi:organic radical activating enzyme